MKSIYFLLFFLMTTTAIAQQEAKTTTQEPSFANRPYYISNNDLKDMERAEATLNANFINGELAWSMFGASSTTMFRQESMPVVIVKIEGGGDPAEVLSLMKMDVKKDRRVLHTGKKLGGKAKDVSQTEMKIGFKKLSGDTYQIVFDSTLTIGEYAFLPLKESNGASALSAAKIKVSCFRIN